jgi:hypothetical protein
MNILARGVRDARAACRANRTWWLPKPARAIVVHFYFNAPK